MRTLNLTFFLTLFMTHISPVLSHQIGDKQEQGNVEHTDDNTVVMIADRRWYEETNSAITAIRTQLNDLSVILQIQWMDRLPDDLASREENAAQIALETGAVAIFWIDFENDARFLYLHLPKSGERGVLVRGIEGSSVGSMAEALAIIVRASIEATLLENNTDKDDTSEGKTETSPLPAQMENTGAGASKIVIISQEETPGQVSQGENHVERRLELKAAYALSFSSDDIAPSQGLAVQMAMRLFRGFGFFASYLFITPIEHEQNDIFLKLRRHPFCFGATFSYAYRRFEIGGALALGVDYVSEEVKSRSQTIDVHEKGAEVQISMIPLIESSVRLVGNLRLYISAGVEIFLSQPRYIMNSEPEDIVLLDTWLLQPVVLAGLSYGFALRSLK